MPPALTIDYNAIRRALVQATASGIGIDPGFVIMLEPESDTAPRPPRPYAGLMVTSVATKSGWDAQIAQADDPSSSQSNWLYTGPRTMSVSFETYGRTHEEAYGLMVNLQAAFDQEPTLDILGAAGLAVYDIGAVADISTLLNTAYEGRAQMDVSFGMTANSLVDLGRMDRAPVYGQVFADALDPVEINTYIPTEP